MSHTCDRFDDPLQHVTAIASAEVNQALCREVSNEKIKQALDGIVDLKALG